MELKADEYLIPNADFLLFSEDPKKTYNIFLYSFDNGLDWTHPFI